MVVPYLVDHLGANRRKLRRLKGNPDPLVTSNNIDKIASGVNRYSCEEAGRKVGSF